MAQEKLQTISLAGYRSYGNDIEKNKIDLHNINIIIGANGAGKSNLISFLEMVSFMMTRGLRYYVSKQGGTQALLHFGAKRTEQIQGELVIAVEDEDKEDTYSFHTRKGCFRPALFRAGKYVISRSTAPSAI